MVEKFLQKYPYLVEYLTKEKKKIRVFKSNERILKKEIGDKEIIVYPLEKDGLFAKINMDKKEYSLIEPEVDEIIKKDFHKELEKIIKDIGYEKGEVEKKYVEKINKAILKIGKKYGLGKTYLEFIKYKAFRDIKGLGPLDGLFFDPYIEYISVSGGYTFINHKLFGNLKTNIHFSNEISLEKYIIFLSQKMEKNISVLDPLLVGALPDGSRVAIIYGKEIARNGSIITIRKAESRPLDILHLIMEGTLNEEIAAYLWLSLENNISIFFCGPSASGKTTLLNASTIFIPLKAKIYSVETTPELRLVHENWQQTIAQPGRVELFDLLKASLRSRPDYIIIGQIIGKEGNIAFQAMQTGHPVLATFHGSTINRILQRLTGYPIEVPKSFLNNLNVIVILKNIKEGRKIKRIVDSVYEIVEYNPKEGVIVNKVFEYDYGKKEFRFRGLYNSYVLENKIAFSLGLSEQRKIYEIMERKAKYLKELIKKNVKYKELKKHIEGFR